MQRIIPHLWYDYEAKEAALFYTGIFDNSEIVMVSHYGEGEAQDQNAKVNYVGFKLDGMNFAAMDRCSREEVRRITEAFLKMKKFDLKALEQARFGGAEHA